MNRMQLSEKHVENSPLESFEWNGRDVRRNVAFVAEDGTGRVSISIGMSCEAIAERSLSEDCCAERSCRSWYRFRIKYFRHARNSRTLF